jgi:chemotaxis protein methyltransferase CheR
MELMTDEEFRLLRDFITQKCGISYNEKQKYIFQQKILKRLEKNGLNNFKEYYYLLKYNSSKDEIQQLYNVLTVNETYFFREKEHLSALNEHILPEMLKKGQTDILKY